MEPMNYHQAWMAKRAEEAKPLDQKLLELLDAKVGKTDAELLAALGCSRTDYVKAKALLQATHEIQQVRQFGHRFAAPSAPKYQRRKN